MKKSLVLAMAMALGVTASAYAANPFSDVPAGHWAYDSISKLAAAGVVEGYADGSFKGENLMTRYEMAQIVAKAMAKGANVDALAAEFADELDNLGVRVAALEKKADNVKITGQIRYNYAKDDGGAGSADKFRTRLWIAGQINEDWKYTGMIQNQQRFNKNDVAEENDLTFQRAYLDGKLGGLKVRAGRYNYTTPTATSALAFGSDLYDTRIDGVTVKYGKGVTLEGTAGKLTDAPEVGDPKVKEVNKFAAANLVIPMGKAIKVNGGYYNFNGQDNAAYDKEIVNVGLTMKVSPSLAILGDWMKVNSDNDEIDGNDGWVVGANYKGAKAAKVGSYGIAAKYVDFEDGVVVSNGWNATVSDAACKGVATGAYVTVAKNIVAGVEYYNLKAKGSTNHEETLWSQLVFTF